jgi:hypothetical protein
MMVSVGFIAVAETKNDESTTYTLSTSCSLQFRSRAEERVIARPTSGDVLPLDVLSCLRLGYQALSPANR